MKSILQGSWILAVAAFIEGRFESKSHCSKFARKLYGTDAIGSHISGLLVTFA